MVESYDLFAQESTVWLNVCLGAKSDGFQVEIVVTTENIRTSPRLLLVSNGGSRFPYTQAMFSEKLLDHFRNPRNAGELAEPAVTVEVSNPVCGDVLRLSALMEGGRITETRFKIQGCVAAIASGSALTELLTGKTPGEAKGISAGQISDVLGGLPPATFHAAQLCIDGVAALLPKLER
jgi:nitrogen fixation NifU-like protein